MRRRPALLPAATANPRHFRKGGLLDLSAARRWMAEIDCALENDRYGYQLPVQMRHDNGQIEMDGRLITPLSSYDYLGLIDHPAVQEAACEALQTFGAGTGGVRLLTGTNRLHEQLENAIARFTGAEAALTVTSGYLANLTPWLHFFGQNDLIVSDERAHRSLSDSSRLTGAEVLCFPHNDMDALENILKKQSHSRRKLIITEGVFSMDGDLCPLPHLVQLKQAYNAFLLVDEAHSLGVTGATGRGIHEHFDLPASTVDIWTGSLSKTIPSNGGYVAGDAALILYLQHAGAPFFFSSAMAPAATAAALAAFQVMNSEPQRVLRLRQNAVSLKKSLQQIGYDTGLTDSAIIPVITGNSPAAHDLARALYERGFLATAVVYPAVPVNGARLRLCARADMNREMLQATVEAFEEAAGLFAQSFSGSPMT